MKLGRAVVIAMLSLLFVAYSNFAPTSLGSPLVDDYVKNHFLREVMFGVLLTLIAIKLSLNVPTTKDWFLLAIVSNVVVMPFWIAVLFGWSTDGLAEVWGGEIDETAAYLLHGTQAVGLLIGLLLMWPTPTASEGK
jgi:hypothetical protein